MKNAPCSHRPNEGKPMGNMVAKITVENDGENDGEDDFGDIGDNGDHRDAKALKR